MAAAEKHYFVINQQGLSADRRGPFVSAQAAKDWAKEFYRFPCWVIPAEYIGVMNYKPLNEKGERVEEG